MLRLAWVEGDYAICRLPAHARLSALPGGRFLTISRTSEELSVVCATAEAPEGAKVQGPYALFRVAGDLPLDLTGILASILDPLRDANVPIFAISTFDTDYVLVQSENAARAETALVAAGHEFVAAVPD